MKITSKGQVTNPLPIQSESGLKPDTAVEFIVEGGNVVLRPKRKQGHPVDAWLEEAIGVARGKTTTAKMMKLTRSENR